MRTVRSVAELRRELKPARRSGSSIGLVPTMGALHDGHVSLLRRAVSMCDVVVMSLFVNPAQFSEAADLDGYPRDEARDAALAAELGVDYLFAPAVTEVYPQGFSTSVSVAGVSAGLEGEHRGQAHFQGVATVVTKLLNMASPDVAYFGRKDAQQAVVIRRMVRDLDLPVEIEVCPTVRASDGLALSSRNALLSVAERRRATALHRALQCVRAAVLAGETDPDRATRTGRSELDHAGLDLDYLSLVDPETMAPLLAVRGDALAVVGARVGAVRLIDNIVIEHDVVDVTQDDQIRTIDHAVATPFGAPTT
ncbi:MAG: pantoate--beta-alanine ligase [Solirubrobacteraceae bacterium]